MRTGLVTGRVIAAIALVVGVGGGVTASAGAGEDDGDDGPRVVDVEGSHNGHGQGGLDLPGLGNSGNSGGVDYPCYFYRPLADDFDRSMALDEAEDLTVAMLFAGLIEWSQVSPSPRLTWPLVVGQPYYRDCYLPGQGPGTNTPAFTDEFCYRSPCGSNRTIDEVIENLTAMVDPGPPIPVANPPLDSIVVGIENRLGVGQLLVEMTHTPDETGVLGLAASISAVPVRVEWAIDGEVFLSCGPDESMIGPDGAPGCAHTFSTNTGGPVDGSVTVFWDVEATITHADGSVQNVPQPPVIEQTDVVIEVREVEALLR
jgi:hypothetical protein